jgi:hypothetical protein
MLKNERVTYESSRVLGRWKEVLFLTFLTLCELTFTLINHMLIARSESRQRWDSDTPLQSWGAYALESSLSSGISLLLGLSACILLACDCRRGREELIEAHSSNRMSNDVVMRTEC